MKFFPQTAGDIKEMLDKCGVKQLDDLYADIPESIRFRGEYDIPSEMSELEIREFFTKLANQNQQLVCFAGAGVYDHYTPSLIPQITSRSEFLTSYTPYQAEISQGRLEALLIFQTMISSLTGFPLSNCSMLDDAQAAAEAMRMMFELRSRDAVKAGKNVVFVDENNKIDRVTRYEKHGELFSVK